MKLSNYKKIAEKLKGNIIKSYIVLRFIFFISWLNKFPLYQLLFLRKSWIIFFEISKPSYCKTVFESSFINLPFPMLISKTFFGFIFFIQ